MGMPASPKSDWYALGVIAYKLLTGMWCDAKTDVTGTLDTYDPVWKRIIPKLLHSNPEGRECLSYSEEKKKDREAQEVEWEERWIAAKSRGHFARHIARYAVAASVLLLAALCWQVRESRMQREVLRLKYEASGLRPAVPSFDDLFRIPVEAKGEEQTDADGEVVMYSRPQFEAARIDALVLTHDTLSGLASGDITLEKAISDFEKMVEMLDDGTLFDNLGFGGIGWTQCSDSDESLKMLLERAIEKLKAAAEG